MKFRTSGGHIFNFARDCPEPNALYCLGCGQIVTADAWAAREPCPQPVCSLCGKRLERHCTGCGVAVCATCDRCHGCGAYACGPCTLRSHPHQVALPEWR